LSDHECTLYWEKDSIAWIMLNRPEVLNALNSKLWREIYENLDRAGKSQKVRAVVITGAGRAFCAGDDIKEISNLKTPEEAQNFFWNFAAPTITKIVSLPKPVIAAVNGLAYGGGCEIAMLCDLVVASQKAMFAVPEALIGAIPPVAAVVGAFIIGRLNVNWMMLTGEPITAEEAKRIGLVNEVVPHEELLSATERLAKATMRAAPSSIKAIKKLTSLNFDQRKLRKAVEELINIVQTEEGKEGHRAFVEKRPPKWAEV